ncbi:MAG TPA: DUF4440 domain-containing protein [Bryobacteraceae bacterium]|nr:DUF4440 domain-containing protein [Bryobacteraceae bacterium]
MTSRRDELVRLAQQRFKAFFEGDREAYLRLVAEDAVFAYSNGRTLDYRQAMSELAPLAKAGTYQFHYEDVRFRDFGDSALLVYRLVFSGPAGDYEGVEIDTFALRDHIWKLVAVHGTTIPYPNRPRPAVASALLDEYVGRYQQAPGVYYDITREGDRLLGQRNRFAKVPWVAESNDIFYVSSDPAASRVFLRDPQGRVSKTLRIDIEGTTEWKRLPQE